MEKGMKVVRKYQEVRFQKKKKEWDWAPLNHSPVKSWLQYYAAEEVCTFVLV